MLAEHSLVGPCCLVLLQPRPPEVIPPSYFLFLMSSHVGPADPGEAVPPQPGQPAPTCSPGHAHWSPGNPRKALPTPPACFLLRPECLLPAGRVCEDKDVFVHHSRSTSVCLAAAGRGAAGASGGRVGRVWPTAALPRLDSFLLKSAQSSRSVCGISTQRLRERLEEKAISGHLRANLWIPFAVTVKTDTHKRYFQSSGEISASDGGARTRVAPRTHTCGRLPPWGRLQQASDQRARYPRTPLRPASTARERKHLGLTGLRLAPSLAKTQRAA